MPRRLDKPAWRRHPPGTALGGYRAAERTQVAIVGAGPSGMSLSHLPEREGVQSVLTWRLSSLAPTSAAGSLRYGTKDGLPFASLPRP